MVRVERITPHTEKRERKRDDDISVMLELAKQGEPIDPEEHPVQSVKGKRGIDKAGILLAIAKSELYEL